MKKFIHKNKLIAIKYCLSEWPDGLNFITPNDLAIQVSSWLYKKGKILDNHYHKNYKRIANKTMEMIYVVNGSMKVSLFDTEKNFIEDFIVKKGDTAIFADGGHGYEILENDTKIIESKNGPFISVEKDKEKF
tara:strand:+ start:120 stop:518 length:399 start_codon:yes stop_codon:yes gene_type:complete